MHQHTRLSSRITPGLCSTHLRCPVHQPRRDHSSRIVKVVHKHCNMIQKQTLLLFIQLQDTRRRYHHPETQMSLSEKHLYLHSNPISGIMGKQLLNLRGIRRHRVNQTNINTRKYIDSLKTKMLCLLFIHINNK